MRPGPYEQVALQSEDKDILLSIYESRKRFLFCVYIILIAIALASANRATSFFGLIPSPYFETGPDGRQVASGRFGMAAIDMVFIMFILGGSGAFFLFRNVLPFKTDAECGMKEKIPFTVIRKQYFPITDQYYVWFDDPEYEHHEVDADTYNKVNEGDNMYVYRAINSKYIFELNGRFTIL